MPNSLNQSRFNMWRAVVAMIHADGVVTPHELAFINGYMKELALTDVQREQISEDIKTPQDIFVIFSQITTPEDKRDFFALARALSWSDGDYDAQEAKIIEKLKLNDDTQQLLHDSREAIEEIELKGNHWVFKTERSRSLFGFLNKWKAA